MSAQTKSGFRLTRLEVFNWGTFSGHHVLYTDGNTALLTGANGSGKSTLVDALLTLMVPTRGTGGRNYNQAAGTSGRERNERSYVRGAHSQFYDERTGTTQVQYLRDEKSYTVLLAVFENFSTEKTLSIARVFWDNSNKKFNVVAERDLNIIEHFSVQSDIGRILPRSLRKLDGVHVHQGFPQYEQDFSRQLHLGEKSITLFNQIVSIKDIGELNTFVRDHMLEEYDAQSAIDNLRSYYQDLNTAYEAIQKAEKQLEVLDPMLKNIQRYYDQRDRIALTDQKIEAVPIYIAEQQLGLLEKLLEQLGHDKADADAQLDHLKQTLANLRNQSADIKRAIDRDDVGLRIRELEESRKRLDKDLKKRQSEASNYQRHLQILGLAMPRSQAEFSKFRQDAENRITEESKREEQLSKRLVDFGVKVKERTTQGEELHDEITSLRANKSNIPRTDLHIRERIARALNLPESTFPFAGELIKVREDFAEWEPAIQRLLGSFGRQLLVPDEYYTPVSDFVENNDLRGRLVYHRVREMTHVNADNLPGNALYHRLQFKTGHLREWLQHHIIDRYAYVCAESLEAFRHANRALTIKGQIKHGGGRHEKDDRSRLGDASRYTLGWENKAKITQLERELENIRQELLTINQQSEKTKHEQRQLRQHQDALNGLLRYSEFSDIDVHQLEQEQAQIQSELDHLHAQAQRSQLAQLQQSLLDVQAQIDAKDAELGVLQRRIGSLDSEITTRKKQQQQALKIYQNADIEALAQILDAIHSDIEQTITLDNVFDIERDIMQRYTSSISNQNRTLQGISREATGLMQQFKTDYPVETQDVDVSLDDNVVNWYRELHDNIVHHDLPGVRQQFQELIQRKITDSVTLFRTAMQDQVAQYRRRIDHLNQALHQIDYTTETYIQLIYQNTRDIEIRDFNLKLSACFPDPGIDPDRANLEAYRHTRALINDLDDPNTGWAKRVTDVRRWLDFSAEERYKSDDSQYARYDGASGKSGGQKAKLAYTIMASAIAYQYGLFANTRAKDKTFRFIVIDEVFSKSDDSNSRYAMELFQQLGLQVLVVTPDKSLHVVEPYIGVCHWVKNRDGQNSVVHNLSIEQLQVMRAEQSGAAD